MGDVVNGVEKSGEFCSTCGNKVCSCTKSSQEASVQVVEFGEPTGEIRFDNEWDQRSFEAMSSQDAWKDFGKLASFDDLLRVRQLLD